MLYIEVAQRSGPHTQSRSTMSVSWHVGEKVKLDDSDVKQVVSVQADGDELSYIKQHFTGLPMSGRPVVEWFGDHAKFIARHLPW